jgi:hypothetical protein
MAEMTYERAMKALKAADAAATNAGDPAARAAAAADAKRLAAIAKRLKEPPPSGGVPNNSALGQANKGIANTIDFLNPFDNPAWENIAGGRFHTGSAADAMRGMGVAVAEREPETVVEGFGRGVGDAASALPLVLKGLQMLRGAGGAMGQIADDAYRALSTPAGMGAEAVAGGVGGSAREVSEAAGAPDWVSDVAEIAAPALALPGAIGGARLVGRNAAAALSKLPITGTAMRMGRDVRAALTPMTEGGAREVARDELLKRVGPERAGEVAARIDPSDPLGLTPAQMAGDPELLKLQNAAGQENPELRARLEERGEDSRGAAVMEVTEMGGDYSEARAFFRTRLNDYRKRLSGAVERVFADVDRQAEALGPDASEAANSSRVVGKLKAELADAQAENKSLWNAVPLEEVVPTGESRKALQEFIETTPQAQKHDIPDIARRFLGPDGQFGQTESAMELHGLYSELRGIARAAMSGEPGRRKPNLARIANGIADAILDDLGAVDASTPVGKAINDALAHTRAMHETFDKGAPGRILKRTTSGDEAIPEEAALEKTVGRGGIVGDVDAAGIAKAAPGSQGEVADYLRSQFSEALIGPTGEYNARAAAGWLRKNRELLLRHPQLKREFYEVMGNRLKAEGFATRAELRAKLADDTFAAQFTGDSDRAVRAILQAEDPLSAARSVSRTAAKDRSGKALEGVKAAFSDFLIGQTAGADGLLNGRKLFALVNDPKMAAALKQIYTPAEHTRLKKIAEYMRTLDAPVGDSGPVIDRPANALLETVVRIAAARQGGKLGAGGGMGGSLQTANIFANRATRMLERLTNDRARRLLMDAVEDPKLMRELLTEPKGVKLPERTRMKLAPYLTGAAAVAADKEGDE